MTNNTLVNSALKGVYDGSIALNISNQTNGTITDGGIVANNIVENCGGVAIAVASSTSYGKTIISGNQVRNAQGHGIYCPTRNSIITGNQIYNWGLRNSSDNAIYHSEGTTCTDNRMYNDTYAALVCIRTVFSSGYKYTFRDNLSTTNPIFTGSTDVIAFGATTIASGATTQTPSHLMMITPAVYEIQVVPSTNATNDPGNWWISNITSTQFTINVRNNPGASGIVFNWRAELVQPFTAP